MQRYLRWGGRVAFGAMIVAGIAYLLMGGSDAMEVRGTIDLEGSEPKICLLTLKTYVGAIGTVKQRPASVGEPQTIASDEPIHVTFILHGPSNREHWLEIDCPGYETHRTRSISAPSVDGRNVDLGEISLRLEARTP